MTEQAPSLEGGFGEAVRPTDLSFPKFLTAVDSLISQGDLEFKDRNGSKAKLRLGSFALQFVQPARDSKSWHREVLDITDTPIMQLDRLGPPDEGRFQALLERIHMQFDMPADRSGQKGDLPILNAQYLNTGPPTQPGRATRFNQGVRNFGELALANNYGYFADNKAPVPIPGVQEAIHGLIDEALLDFQEFVVGRQK